MKDQKISFDTEHALSEFREKQGDYFNNLGESYNSHVMSCDIAEEMFALINILENELKDTKPEPRTIESLTDEEWKGVLDVSDTLDGVVIIKRKGLGVKAWRKPKTGKRWLIGSYYVGCKSFGSFYFNQYAAFKRLESLGVKLD